MALQQVLWTGNGFHIYQPIDALILEEFMQFEEFENPSLKFIRFAEFSLTSGKSDPSHNPSFNSCMIRIPGSYNSKYSPDKNELPKMGWLQTSNQFACWVFSCVLGRPENKRNEIEEKD
jgi:hypothetical protein